MKKYDMHHGYWLAGKGFRALGVWGILGTVMMIACAIFYFTHIEQVEKDTLSIRESLQQIKTKGVVPDTFPAIPVQSTQEEVISFYQRFPSGVSLPKWLSLIDQTALKHHLILNHGDYKLTQLKQGQLSRYEIVLPVVGQYLQMRAFISDVLQKIPAIALNDLQIRRESALTPAVEGRLVFVLFLQGDTW